MTPEEFKEIRFHSNMKIELNNGEVYQLLQVDFNNEIISFRANDGYITHATINYVKRVFDSVSTNKNNIMKAIIYGKEFQAKQTNGKYFYYSPRTMRWLPTSKNNIV